MNRIAEILLDWYAREGRDLPWRRTRDPYRIWLSEVILQQTRVAQGMEYYLRFTERFPDVASLAAAPEDEVLKLWQGLGYYSRARNLLAAARQVVERFGGVFPVSPDDVRSLRGVPVDRAAGADLSFFHEALRRLRAGRCVAIFPEGALNPTETLLPFKQGAALLALQAGVPVIPVYSAGNYQPFQRLQLRFGAPIVMGYWCGPSLLTSSSRSVIALGGSKSGKPCARLIAPHARLTRVMRRMTESVNNLFFLLISCIVYSCLS